jgi:hypothetical protein
MRFTIIRSESMVVIDNAPLVLDCSSVPANVEVVAYEDTDGTVEYNDRPSVRVTFTDPSPYQPILNSWVTASAALTPALQLAQAKTIKAGLVEAIFHHKRRLPYSSGGWNWDTNNDALASLETLVRACMTVSASSGGLITSINDTLAALITQINSQIVGQVNISAEHVNGWSQVMEANWSSMDHTFESLNGTTGGASTGTAHTHAYTVFGYHLTWPYHSTGSGGFVTLNNITGGTVSAPVSAALSYEGNITTQPLNATSLQSIPATLGNTALQGIAARRESLNSNRINKKAAVNALTTIPAVVAYDATTGWSF